jgi:hypothetical protein
MAFGAYIGVLLASVPSAMTSGISSLSVTSGSRSRKISFVYLNADGKRFEQKSVRAYAVNKQLYLEQEAHEWVANKSRMSVSDIRKMGIIKALWKIKPKLEKRNRLPAGVVFPAYSDATLPSAT